MPTFRVSDYPALHRHDHFNSSSSKILCDTRENHKLLTPRIYLCINLFRHTSEHTCIDFDIHPNTPASISTYIRTHLHLFRHTSEHTCIYFDIHPNTPASFRHTSEHTCIYFDIHPNTPASFRHTSEHTCIISTYIRTHLHHFDIHPNTPAPKQTISAFFLILFTEVTTTKHDSNNQEAKMLTA
jgi:hypothetical protein